MLGAALLATGACYGTRAYTGQPITSPIPNVHIAFDSTFVDLRDATVQDSVFTGAMVKGDATVEFVGGSLNDRPVVRVDARRARAITASQLDPRRTTIATLAAEVAIFALVWIVSPRRHPDVVC